MKRAEREAEKKAEKKMEKNANNLMPLPHENAKVVPPEENNANLRSHTAPIMPEDNVSRSTSDTQSGSDTDVSTA